MSTATTFLVGWAAATQRSVVAEPLLPEVAVVAVVVAVELMVVVRAAEQSKEDQIQTGQLLKRAVCALLYALWDAPWEAPWDSLADMANPGGDSRS